MKKPAVDNLRDPLVSVCIATNDNEKYIVDAIESIFAQTYQNWELVIVDDASSDATVDLLNTYQKRYPEKIKVTLLSKSRGQAYAFNHACSLAKGKYMARLDSDDRAHETRLANQVNFLQKHPEVGAVLSKVYYINASGQVFEAQNDLFNDTQIINLPRQLLQRNFLHAQSAMIRAHVFSELNGYDYGLLYKFDYDFWLRLLNHHEIVRLDDKLTYHRICSRNKNLSDTFSLAYESGICVLRAVKSWPIEKTLGLKEQKRDKLYACKDSRASAYAELGGLCLDLDQKYFGRPLLATSTAYKFTLKALTYDSDCLKARAVMHKVYEVLGYNPSAKDKWLNALTEWKEDDATNQLAIDGYTQNHEPIEYKEATSAETDCLEEQTDHETLYQRWIDRNTLGESQISVFNERFNSWDFEPLFHVILPLQSGEENLLADTIDSLGQQLYQNWRLSVVADFSCPNPLFDELEILEWIQTQNTGEVCKAANNLLDSVSASWVLWITPGAILEPHFLNVCGDYINLHPEWRLIYTDEDVINPEGNRQDPTFKPDFNLDLLRSTSYVGNAVLVQRDALREVGGYENRYIALINYDTTFKICDLYGELSIGHIAELLFHQTSKQLVDEKVIEAQGHQVLQAHLNRKGIDGTVKIGLLPGSFFIDYPLSSNPLVSIIIPTRDRLDLLKPCLESLLTKTSYTNYEVLIVDNNSVEPETVEFFKFVQTNDERVRIIKYPHEFNFSAINNEAARQAQGVYLVLLNNDTLVVQDNWLDRMLAHGLRPEVGVVGCRLVYPDQKLQHGGVILGLGGLAEFAHHGLAIHEPGYMQRAQMVQNFSAVSAACLLVEKSLYFETGGFDEDRFPVLFNDVDFCLKVGETGRKIVWTPYVTLVHHGASSLKNIQDPKAIKRFRKRADTVMLEKWLPKLTRDPAYNRHLSLSHKDCRIEAQADAPWDVNFRDRFRVLAAPFNSFGTGEYRVRAPVRALEKANLAQCALLPGNDEVMRLPEIVELERLQPDTLLLQNADQNLHLVALERYKKFANHIFRVFGQDDLVFQVPQKNPFRQAAPKDLKWRVRKALSLCDRLIVATAPMAEALRGMIDDICVVPNYLEDGLWQGLLSQRRIGHKPRVGWAGAQQHQGDLELIVPLVKATAQEFDWVFFGMCPEVLRPYIKEFHGGVPFVEYPAKLASLNLDVAVAPLEHNRFNVAKSNLRLLEYGIMGWPTICSDIEPYRNGNAPVVRVPNNPNAWIKAVREYAYDLDAAAAEGDKLKQWILDNWMLSNHAEEWLQALMPH